MKSKITEAQLSNADTKAVFKTADKLANSGISKFTRAFKKKVDISDLQKAWQEAGYPDDTRDIGVILKDHGFSPKEINKVFSGVFGQQDSGNSKSAEPTQSPVIQKIAKYAIDNGIAEELKTFLAQEYGFKESTSLYGKAMVENVRDIFTEIVKEERNGRQHLIKEYEQTHLGRIKK
jgi:hypothetical protein